MGGKWYDQCMRLVEYRLGNNAALRPARRSGGAKSKREGKNIRTLIHLVGERGVCKCGSCV